MDNILKDTDLQFNDPPALAWITVQDAVKLLWAENPKLHDLGAVIESINKHGLQELPKFDANLPNAAGEDGAIKAGNGRVEALAVMEKEQYKLPRGMGRTKEGQWALPVLVGVDAGSRALAESYAIDSNNLTLGGGNFDAFDMARLWKQDEYVKILGRLALESGEHPVSVDGDSLDLLIKNLTGYTDESTSQGNGNKEKEKNIICPECGYEWIK